MKDNQAVSTSITFSAEKALEQLNAVNETLSKIASQIDKVIVNTTKASTKTKGVTQDINKSLKNMNFKSVVSNLKNIFSTIKTLSEPAIDYIEDLNLLKVAFGDTADSARDMIDEIADTTGFDTSTLTRMTATFRQLTSTLGMGAENADLLSTNLTKMALDVSSLYNLDLDTTASALQGAFTGQPRSIKAYTGANVTDEALQQELAARGIDRKTSSLNQGEKAIVTYLALERQLINSNGDLSRTIEQPSNQLKIFSEQIKRAAKNIGNLIIPVLQKVLPYLNAFLMVFSEIVEWLMTILGIDTDSFWESMSSGSGDLSTSLDNLTSSAKEALLGLRGFDKLNVIKTPTESSTSGGLGGLNIDSKILDQLEEYNLQLDKVKSKATEIRDKIMEWLGFTKQVDDETGKVTWKLGDGHTNLEKIYDAIKFIFDLVVTYKVLSFLGDVVSVLGGGKKSDSILTSIINIGSMIGKVFGATGLTTLGEFALGLGGILGIATAVWAMLQLVAEIDTSSTKETIEWWTEQSPETANRIGNVRTAIEELQSAIDMVSYSNLEIDEETYNNIITKIQNLKTSFLTELDDWYAQELGKLNELYPTEEEKQRESYIIQKEELENKYKEMEGINEEYISEYTKKFKEFYNDDKKISTEERLELLEIQKKIEGLSIEALSTSIDEKNKLHEEYEKDSGAIDTRTQLNLLKSNRETLDKLIKEENEKFKERKNNLDTEASNYEEQLKKLEKERDTAIATATTEYDKFYKGWASANSNIAQFIDKDTGEIFSNMTDYFGDTETTIQAILNTISGTADDETKEIVGYFATMGNQIYNELTAKNYYIEKYGIEWWNTFKNSIMKQSQKSPLEIKANVQGIESYKGGVIGSITAKADGGFVNTGQMFVARENGPELVGKIGNKTAVANNNQIVQAVAQGVASAITSSGGMGSKVVIEATGDSSGLMNFITFKQKEQSKQFGL